MRPNLFWVEGTTPGRLAIAARPRAGDWLEDELRGFGREGVSVVVSLLTIDEVRELGLEGEEAACLKVGLEFRAFPIPDRECPADSNQTAAFIEQLAQALREGQSIVVHCRMGIGRSSLMAAATLKRLGVSPDDAFRRLSEARGFPVPDTAEQRRWVEDFRA
jgi:protein-tyrosine phosphatase